MQGGALLRGFVTVGDGDHVLIGYHTLAAASTALAELPEALAKRLPRYLRFCPRR